MNSLQLRQQEIKLANTNEAKVLLPILNEYSQLYAGQLQNEAVKKKNILILANELAKVQINGRPAIEAASASSIRQVALQVITEDIDLSKKQANIIPYGNDITLQKQFYGNVALAKQQYGNHIEFYSQLVYPNDQFEIVKNGLGYGRDEYKHTSKPSNMVSTNESGYKVSALPTFVYTYVVDIDTNKVIATNCFSYQRCYNSWTQSGIKPTHKKFPGEMMIKTSESYIATRLYNKSNTDNDNQLEDEWEDNTPNDAIVVDNFDVESDVLKEEPKKVVKKVSKKVEEPTANVVNDEIQPDYDSWGQDVIIDDEIPQSPESFYGEPQDEIKEQPQVIKSFIDTLNDDEFEVEPPKQEPQKKTLHVKYKDYIEKYKTQGYKVVNGSWNADDKTCDIELND